jgi:hypothetical protein
MTGVLVSLEQLLFCSLFSTYIASPAPWLIPSSSPPHAHYPLALRTLSTSLDRKLDSRSMPPEEDQVTMEGRRRRGPAGRVTVVYYLCRHGRHLEHPHLMELALASPNYYYYYYYCYYYYYKQ